MTLRLTLSLAPPSWLTRWDARWKLAATLIAVLCLALLRAWPVALGGLAIALGVTFAARLSRRDWLRRVGPLTLVLLLFLVWVPLVPRSGEDGVPAMGLRLSPRGLRWVAALLSKTIALVTLLWALLATTPLHVLLQAAHRLRVPAVFIQLFMLTHRYVHLLTEEWGRIRTALRVRGFRACMSGHAYRTVGQVVGTMLVRGHERAERVGQAMRARGFSGTTPTLHEFRAQAGDILLFAVSVLLALAMLGVDFWLR
jgi:cobalt/nickel transport system permease protein